MTRYALSPAELAAFERDGFVGPFSVYSADEAAALLTTIRCEAHDRSLAPFGDSTINYDRHLDITALSHHVTRPQIVERVASLLGADLLCWRTEFFTKRRGEAPTGWHQVETYAVGGGPAMLRPTERKPGAPTELTVWTTLTEATREMSCLKFLPGSHKRWYYDEQRKMSFRADEVGSDRGSFFGYDYDELKLDPSWEPDEAEVVELEMQPGECVLFTARTVHGSATHTARKARVAVAARYVPTSVRVYAGMDSFTEFGETLSTARHANVLVSGVDRFGHNRIADRNARGERFFAKDQA